MCSVYSIYNTAGSYYFGSDRAAALDTDIPIRMRSSGSIFAYGDDNKKQVNHGRYKQAEWFVQDTWKAKKTLTFDFGMRFYRVGDLYSAGGTLGLFRAEEYDAEKAGQLLFPALVNGAKATIAINPVTGATFPYIRQGTFDTASYPANGIPFCGIHQYDSHFFNTSADPARSARRICVGYLRRRQDRDARRFRHHSRTQLDGGQYRRHRRGRGSAWRLRRISRRRPSCTRTSPIWRLRSLTSRRKRCWAVRRTRKSQSTYNWSYRHPARSGARHDPRRFLRGQRAAPRLWPGDRLQCCPPLTTWTPSGGAVAQFKDPTSTGFYSTNLIRAMVGYSGYASIPVWTYLGTENYNSLQVQLNRRVGRLQWNANYTFSRTTPTPSTSGPIRSWARTLRTARTL